MAALLLAVNKMRSIRSVVFWVGLGLLLIASCASAQTFDAGANRRIARATSASWQIASPSCSAEAAPAARSLALAVEPAWREQDESQPLHASAVEHSDAYETRKKIHKIASFATLPLFAAEVALGQSIYNTANVSSGNRSAHIVVGTGIMALFGVNTITGAWNMFGEDRQDPKGRTLRLVHGLLMMAADAGFVATSVTGPHGRRGTFTIPTGEATHRAIAFSSIGIGTTGYLVMLIGN